jgi:hypothetical protein
VSPVFRSNLEISQPEAWSVKESMTLVGPGGMANVIFSSEPLDPNITAQRYADAQGEVLRKEFNGYREDYYEPALIFGGRPGFVRQFQWTPEEGPPVTQIQFYYAANGRGYTATATTPSSEFSDQEPELRRIMAGLSIWAGR